MPEVGYRVNFIRDGVAGLAGAALVAGLGLLLAGCPSQSSESSSSPAPVAQAAAFGGTVWGGRQPISGSKVVAYAAATAAGAAPSQLGTATTLSDGTWTMPGFSPPSDGQVVYVVASGGDALGGGGSATNDAIKLMTIAGVWGSSLAPVDTDSTVNVNELSTVAATGVLKDYIQFVDCSTVTTYVSGTCVSLSGATGLAQMAATIGNLVSVQTGAASTFLTAQADGSSLNTTLRKMDTLANILAGCVNTSGTAGDPSTPCQALFDAAPPGISSSDTLKAAWLAAANPAANADGDTLYALQGVTVFSPILAAAPTDWTVGGDRFAYVSSGDGTVAYRLGSLNDALISSQPSGAVTPWSIAMDPTGSYVYTANYGAGGAGGNVSQYKVGSNGVLTAIGTPVDTGDNGPHSIAVDPTGQYVYVANSKSNNVAEYSINPDGTLEKITTTPTAAATAPLAVAVEPTGKYAYVTSTNQKVTVYSINQTSGQLSAIGAASTGALPWSIVVEPTGHYAYVANYSGNSISEYSINQTNGRLALSGTLDTGAGSGPHGVTVDPTGHYVYVANYDSNTVSAYSINQTNGSLTAIGTDQDTAVHPYSVTVDPLGRFVYVANLTGISISKYAIDAEGTLSPAIASVDTVTDATAISVVVDPTGSYLFAGEGGIGNVVSYEIGSGAPTQIATYEAGAMQSVAMGPLGRYLYAVNSLGVTDYTIATDGTLALDPDSPYTAGTAPNSVAVDSTGSYVYVANKVSNNVSAYAIDKLGGGLTAIGAAPAGSFTSAIAADPAGPFVYTADGFFNDTSNSSVSAYAISSGPTPGSLDAVAGSYTCGTMPDPANCFEAGVRPLSLAVDPSGSHLYVANYGGLSISTYDINPTTGFLTAQSPTSIDISALGIAVNPTGRYLYIADTANYSGVGHVEVYPVNSDGSLGTMIGKYSTEGDVSVAVGVCPTGKYVYVANNAGNSLAVFAVLADGSLVAVPGSPFSGVTAPTGIAVGP